MLTGKESIPCATETWKPESPASRLFSQDFALSISNLPYSFKIPRRSRCVGSSPTPATMGKQRIIKAISSVVKPPKGGFFVPPV